MKNYTVRPAIRREVDHLIREHYLHCWPAIPTCILGLLDENEMTYIGVIVFALPPRETAIRYGVSTVWELARLFIEDGTPKNTETWFMARAIKYVRRQLPPVEMLVSYADPAAGHSGIIYRAGNWKDDGDTEADRKTPRTDYIANGVKFGRRSHIPEGVPFSTVPRQSKHRFIYQLAAAERTGGTARGPRTRAAACDGNRGPA